MTVTAPTKTAKKKTMSRRRKAISAVALGTCAFGAALGSAASLSVSGTAASLGAGVQVVASCQLSGTITMTYGYVYDTTIGGYKVNSATVNNVDATGCTGKTVGLTLKGTTGAFLGANTVAVTGTGSQNFTISTFKDITGTSTVTVDASAVLGAAVVIA